MTIRLCWYCQKAAWKRKISNNFCGAIGTQPNRKQFLRRCGKHAVEATCGSLPWRESKNIREVKLGNISIQPWKETEVIRDWQYILTMRVRRSMLRQDILLGFTLMITHMLNEASDHFLVWEKRINGLMSFVIT